MTDRTETYDVGDAPHLSIFLHAGDIRLKAGDIGSVTVALSGNADAVNEIDIDANPEGVTVRSPGKQRRWFGRGTVDALVSVPAGADVTIHNGAGDVFVGLEVNDLEVHTGAGDIRVEDVSGTTELKVGSGDIRAGAFGSSARISTASGDVRLESVGELTVSTAAGDISIGSITDSAMIKSATGDIRIRKFAGTDLEIKTMSGDVTIGLIPGMIVNAAIKTLSGDLRNRIKPSSGEKTGSMNLAVTSFAGDVTLKSAS